MTDAATIDYLNIQIRMMTEGFKEAVEEVQDGLEEIQDEVEETSDVFDDMDSRAGEIGNGIGVTLGRLSPKFGKLRQSIKQITTAFGEAGNASKLATTAMAASIAAVAAGAVYQIGSSMYKKLGELVAITNSKQYLQSTEQLNTSIKRLKATLSTTLAPLFNALTLAIDAAVNAFTWWAEKVMAPTYGFLTGLVGAMKDIEDMSIVNTKVASSTGEIADNMGDVADSVERTGKGLAGFDRLTALGSTGLDDNLEDMQLNAEQFEKVKEAMLEAAKAGNDVKNSLSGIGDAIGVAADVLNTLWIGNAYPNIANAIGGFIGSLVDSVAMLDSNVVSTILTWWDNFRSTLTSFFSTIGRFISDLQDHWSSLGSNIKDFFTSLPGTIISNMLSAVTQIKNAFSNAINEIGRMFNGLGFDSIWNDMTNGFKGAINGIIGVWNSTIASIGWEADIFGNKVGINTYGLRITPLANGGVVDPNNPMLAMVGDNKSEKEAVAPLSSLQSMIDEAVSKSMSSPYNNKGGAQDITLAIDGRELARVTYDYMQSEAKRRGATIARG